MKCPDCNKELNCDSKNSVHSFQCYFCGFKDKIKATDSSQAYDILLKGKKSRISQKKLLSENAKEDKPTIPRKTKKEIEQMLIEGGLEPETAPSIRR